MKKEMKSKNRTPQLSIVIPFYNEKGSIVTLLQAFTKFSKKYDFELLCVNNGSTDGSEKILYGYANKKNYHFMQVITIESNKGYGHGIMTGVKKAKGAVIAWTHADMQTHPSDVFKAYELFKKENNTKTIIKGVRLGRPMLDGFVSMWMGVLVSILLRGKYCEINAQPKLFHRSMIPHLSTAPNDFLLDLYLLYKAQKHNYTIKSIKVNFPKRLHGKSKWAYSLPSRLKMVKRTIHYTFSLSKFDK